MFSSSEIESLVGEWELAYTEEDRGRIVLPTDDEIRGYVFKSNGKYEHTVGGECRSSAKYFVVGEPSENGTYSIELRKHIFEQYNLRFVSEDTIYFNVAAGITSRDFYFRK